MSSLLSRLFRVVVLFSRGRRCMSQVNPDLESLDLSSNSVGAQGVAALAEALAENAHVTALFLASNGVNAQGAVALSKALKVNDSITELHLWNNALGVAGSASIAHALKVNRALQVCIHFYIYRYDIFYHE